MMDENTTRRRVIQGAGVVGLTGIVGSSVVSAQEGSPTGTPADGTALRVAHVSPDAPAVNVLLDDQTAVQGLGFGTVSDYQSVDPGTYQLQVVPANGGFLGGLLDDLFGSNQQGDTVLFEQSVTVEQGATYTAVAYGEAEQGPAATPTEGGATPTETAPDGGATPTESPIQDLQAGGQGQGQGQGGGPLVQGLAFGDEASATVPAGDYRLLIRPTDGGGMTPTDGAAADEGTPFQVSLLEDDLSSPPQGESRVRLFHAVPDLGPVTVVATPQGQNGGQGQGQGTGQPQGQGPGAQAPPISTDVSLEAGTVYSSFAAGYADPQAAAEGTPTEGSPAGAPAEESPTPADGSPTAAAASPTATPGDGDLPGFELIVVETATDGERVQGGGT